MKPFAVTSILAPTDLSDSSIPALRYARLFADRFNAKLTVMYTEPIVYPVEIAGPADGLYIDTTPEHQAGLRGEVERHADPIMQGRSYDIDVTIGQPVPSILAAAKERNADLVIMGTHLRHGWRRALLGSVSEGVLHGTESPVLTVATHDGSASPGPHAITNIMCPVNFTDVARESLRVAGRIAEAFGARLTIVHVIESDDATDPKADEERVREWVAPELQAVTSYRELIVRGGAAERVLDCADDLGADFLVIGAQHKLFRDTTVIGATTERLIRFASCPVLVVPRQVVREESHVPAPEQHANSVKIDANQPIGKFAAEVPGAIGVFEALGIDYACLCDRSLDDAAHAGGIAPDVVIGSLRRLKAVREGESWSDRPLADLTRHLTHHHHQFVRHELGRLALALSDVCTASADVPPDLVSLRAAFTKLSEVLLPHLHREETSVFPAIEGLEKTWQAAETAAAPVDLTVALHQLAVQHAVFSAQLSTMRELGVRLSDSNELPRRCAAIVTDLATLEAHLHEYMFLENWVLFPRAAALAEQTREVPALAGFQSHGGA